MLLEGTEANLKRLISHFSLDQVCYLNCMKHGDKVVIDYKLKNQYPDKEERINKILKNSVSTRQEAIDTLNTVLRAVENGYKIEILKYTFDCLKDDNIVHTEKAIRINSSTAKMAKKNEEDRVHIEGVLKALAAKKDKPVPELFRKVFKKPNAKKYVSATYQDIIDILRNEFNYDS